MRAGLCRDRCRPRKSILPSASKSSATAPHHSEVWTQDSLCVVFFQFQSLHRIKVVRLHWFLKVTLSGPLITQTGDWPSESLRLSRDPGLLDSASRSYWFKFTTHFKLRYKHMQRHPKVKLSCRREKRPCVTRTISHYNASSYSLATVRLA